MAHQEAGRGLVNRFIKDVSGLARIERPAKQMGRIVILTLGPK